MNHSSIRLAHGNGGLHSQRLLEDVILKNLKHPSVKALEDSVILPWESNNLVFTTDSFVVQPLFFPGGNIGKLAVCGTVNDLSMMGAKPLYISIGLIIEEGFPIKDLEEIIQSMQQTALEAKVDIVTGDTKVVPKGQADGIYINTSGVGQLIKNGISVKNAQNGDVVILSGPIGKHGMAIALAREYMGIQSQIQSDVAPLSNMIHDIVLGSNQIHVMRDITRGGLATILNEIAAQSDVGIKIEESNIPIPEDVQTACDMLGFDPFYLSNEGACVVVTTEKNSEKVIEIMSRHTQGSDAAKIGKVVDEHIGQVVLKTEIGSHRLLTMLTGEMLPRIC